MTTPSIDQARIAEAAFYIWLDEGRPEGREEAHWHQAAAALIATAKPARRKAARAKAAPKAEAATAPKAKAEAAAKAPAKAKTKTADKTPAKPRKRKAAAEA